MIPLVRRAFIGLSLLTGAMLVACQDPVTLPTFESSVTQQSAGPGTAVSTLATVRIAGRAPKTGYTREKFKHWIDEDHDGCDTRAEILERDAVNKTFKKNGCIATATIHDPYSNMDIASTAADIDHVVALSDAWQKGADDHFLTDAQRSKLANDPLNLLAVSLKLNRQKGDGDAASWLPPFKAFRCDYVARQTAVKAKYGLWMTQAEHDVIANILDTCPGEPLPKS